MLDGHYGRPRPNTPARKVTARTAAELAFCALGPVPEQWLRSAAASGNTRLGPELAELAASYDSAFRLSFLSPGDAFAVAAFSVALGWLGAYLSVSRYLLEIEPK